MIPMAKRCEYCKVEVRGNPDRCPLCQGSLTGTETEEDDVFPLLTEHSRRFGLIVRSVLFLSFAAIVICLAVGELLPEAAVWPWYVAAAVGCMWLCLANVLIRRHNIPKNIIWMVVWISGLSLAWDYFTGWHHWALDYVVPALCLFAMISVAVISRAMGKEIEEYMIYLIIDGLFGIIPLLFLFMGWVQVRYPSIFCVAGSVLSLGALVTFQGERLREEVRRRLHL